MAQAKSVSLSHFTSAVQAAVKAAVHKHPKFKFEPPHGVAFAYLIRGFPVPEELLTNVTFGETQAFANEVAGHLAEQGGVAEARLAGRGSIFSTGGHIILGFPVPEPFLVER